MKKIIFTALAVVAFSGVSMAKETVDVKEMTTLKNKIVVVDDGGDATPCENMALDFYELATQGRDDIRLLNALIAACH